MCKLKMSMLADIMQTREDWKIFVIKDWNTIKEETFPEDFLTTILTPLYNKGNPHDPANYCYIHIHLPLLRLIEMLVYQKLEPMYNMWTGQNQLGGRGRVEQLSLHPSQLGCFLSRVSP